MAELDFPCSWSFRQWEAQQEGITLPGIDTRSEWERDWERRHPVDLGGYSREFLAMIERCGLPPRGTGIPPAALTIPKAMAKLSAPTHAQKQKGVEI